MIPQKKSKCEGTAVTETLLCIVPFLLFSFALLEMSFMWIERHTYSLAAYEAARVVAAGGWGLEDPCHSQKSFGWAQAAILKNSYWLQRKPYFLPPPVFDCIYDKKNREITVSLKVNYFPKFNFLEKLLRKFSIFKEIYVESSVKREFLGEAFFKSNEEVFAKKWPGKVQGAGSYADGAHREFAKKVSDNVFGLKGVRE